MAAAPKTPLSAESLADEVKRLHQEIEDAAKAATAADAFAIVVRRENTAKIKTLNAVIAMYDDGQLVHPDLRPPPTSRGKGLRSKSWPSQPADCFLSHAGGGRGEGKIRGLCSYHADRFSKGLLSEEQGREYIEKAQAYAAEHGFQVDNAGQLVAGSEQTKEGAK